MSSPSWSESAFGVIHKSFARLEPKLEKVVNAPHTWGRTANMDRRIRGNYAFMRQTAGQAGRRPNWVMDKNNKFRLIPKEKSGKPGPEALKNAREIKDMSRSMVTAAGNRSKRKGRVLP